MKQCAECKLVLPYMDFHKAASCKDGYRTRCKQCYTNKYHRGTLERVVSKIYSQQIRSSITRKHPLPSYSYNELVDWVRKQPTWNQLYNNWIQSNYETMLTPSIDRLDSLLPYALDNIRLVSWKVNHQQANEDVYHGVDTRTLKPVRAINKDGTTYKEYHSISAASRDVGGKSAAHILNVANGIPIKKDNGRYSTPKTCKGFRWEWI